MSNRNKGILPFLLSAVFLAFLYGVAVGMLKIFPYQYFDDARKGFKQVKIEWKNRFGTSSAGEAHDSNKVVFGGMRLAPPYPEAIMVTDQAIPGINLVTGTDEHFRIFAKIIDMDGQVLHTWNVDWFDIWPDATHIPERLMPKSRPGTHIHGALVMENGDLIFNFEHMGLVRIDRDSQVVWRLAYRTHHSIERSSDGNLWVSGQKFSAKPDPRFPQRPARVDKYTILEVSPDGEILNEWFVADLLYDNGYDGLLDFNSISKTALATHVLDDRLHLNDVEPFPDNLPEGFFTRNDILVSLRNVNTVFAFDKQTRRIKYLTTGRFVHQHDPDFIDGNRFSVYDNNNRVTISGKSPQSRIVIISADTDEMDVFYEGTKEHPFFSKIMGKHQWLENGHLLVTESMSGRGFELNQQGDIVWHYYNYIGEGVVRMIEEVQRLPPGYAGFGATPE